MTTGTTPRINDQTNNSSDFDRKFRQSGKIIVSIMNFIVLILSILLIIYISVDTFEKEQLLQNHRYMTFQFWVCIFFMLDFFVGLIFAERRWHYFGHRLAFLLLSIPFLNIINYLQIPLSSDALYFIRFIPLMRGALALSIVIGYMSSNAVTSLFMSYLSIMLLMAYFCSLIFFQCERPVNPEVQTYWSALWWSMMNMSTVGCNINPVTAAGKITAVILPISGMIIFPLFTVYLTNFVTDALKKARSDSHDTDNPNL